MPGIRRGNVGWKKEPWNPGANTLCWYEFNNNYSDNTGRNFDATGTSSFVELNSGQKVLQTDGSNLVLLPIEVTANELKLYTITFWMKVITSSPTYGYYMGDQVRYGSTNSSYGMSFYETTAGRNYFEWTGGYTNTYNGRDITPSGIGTGWRLVTLRSNGTSRTNVSLTINATNTISTGATSGSDSSSIFGNGGQFAIGGRGPTIIGTTGQKTSVQISNLVISTYCRDDKKLQYMYDQTKHLYS